jgi:hypothetical protein
MNLSNKEEQSSAEAEEGRARAKENIAQSNTSPTQSGERVSQGLRGVRHNRGAAVRLRLRHRRFGKMADSSWGFPFNSGRTALAMRDNDAETIARYDEWAPFAASAGTYEVTGNKLITHNIAAKNVRGMTLTEEATIQEFSGDMFVASAKPGEPNSDRQTTYSRVR